MPNQDLKHCATDQEIYDVLMSAKRQVNANDMLAMAKARGIFYSPREPRESLASQISLLTHDFNSLSEVLGQSENKNRAEKVTSVTLNVSLTNEEIEKAVMAYSLAPASEQKVVGHHEGTENYLMRVNYSEIDYTKTRLLQRRQREADIRFEIEKGKTTIRLPANETARAIVEDIRSKLIASKAQDVPRELIEISDLSAILRTEFFTKLIISLEGYSLVDVGNVRVHSGEKGSTTEDLNENEDIEEEGEVDEAEQKMLAVVEHAALTGQGLLASSEYQELQKKGFYITSITWVSVQNDSPHNRIEFDAGFEEPEEGKGFRYNVRGVYRVTSEGGYYKTIKSLKDSHKQLIYPVLEKAAQKVLTELRAKQNVKSQTPQDAGENAQ